MKWHRLPATELNKAETTKAYEAFCVYRDLGPDRSLREVGRRLNKSLTQISKWSGPNDWVNRASAYDDYLAEQDRQAYEKDRAKARKDRLTLIHNVKVKLNAALQNLNVDEPSINEVVNLMKMFLNEERSEYNDLPTQRQELTGKDGQPIFVNWDNDTNDD